MTVSAVALVVLIAGALTEPAFGTEPRFVEETATSGLDSVYRGEWEYMVGGGTAVFDCNADGYPDMFLAGGEAPARLFRNTSAHGGPLRFTSVPASGSELDQVTGAYPLDIDADGIIDLVVLRVGENVVLRGRGNCQFERANEAWGFDGGDGWSTAFAATWELNAHWPTLAIGNYIDRREEYSPWGSCTDNWLHRPAADGSARFASPLPLKPSYCPLSMLFTDWARTGVPDLRVSNDREYYEGGQEQLWHVPAGQPPRLYTEAEGWQRVRIWGMGIAASDLNGDGYAEYFLTSMADQRLQALKSVPDSGPPRPTYEEIALARGVTAHRPFTGDDLKPSTGWHAQFEDVNNDSRADLFIAKGNVDRMPDFAARDPNNLLIQQPDGKFTEMAELAGVASMATSRGAMLADFNLDGRIDLVVVNRRTPAQLWRNTSAGTGHWLQLRLKQAGANRDAIGAWLEIRRNGVILHREITSGGGHTSGSLSWWHIGLGDAATADIRVRWPDGAFGPWQSVSADSFIILERGQPARRWQPAPTATP